MEVIKPCESNESAECRSVDDRNFGENGPDAKSASSQDVTAHSGEIREMNAVTFETENGNIENVSDTHDEVSAVETSDSGCEISGDTSVLETKSGPDNTPHPQNRPGVILLGRGNSFSLGRSEVILLRSRPVKSKRDKAEAIQNEKQLNAISEQSGNKGEPRIPSSPPPISEFVSLNSSAHTNGWHGTDTPASQINSDDVTKESSLNQLWSKAEEIMVARQCRVLKVLEEFGIGESGGGGGDYGGHQEEEQVWQIVQEHFHGQC